MAKILLEPNEVFEHFHSEVSYTTLLEGEATYCADGRESLLEMNHPIFTPANTSHALKNTGDIICVLECGHGSGGK